MTRSPYTRLCFTLPYPYKGRKHENMKTCGWSVGGGGPFSVFVFSPHLREARGKTQAPAERKTTMSTTQAQQTYRVIPFRDGWCILGYQDDRYWVSDGVYTIRAWAVAQAAYQQAGCMDQPQRRRCRSRGYSTHDRAPSGQPAT